MFDALAVAGEGCGAIELVYRRVESAMRLAKVGGHYVRVVKIGARRALMRRARVQNGLPKGGQVPLVCLRQLQPGKRVLVYS